MMAEPLFAATEKGLLKNYGAPAVWAFLTDVALAYIVVRVLYWEEYARMTIQEVVGVTAVFVAVLWGLNLIIRAKKTVHKLCQWAWSDRQLCVDSVHNFLEDANVDERLLKGEKGIEYLERVIMEYPDLPKDALVQLVSILTLASQAGPLLRGRAEQAIHEAVIDHTRNVARRRNVSDPNFARDHASEDPGHD